MRARKKAGDLRLLHPESARHRRGASGMAAKSATSLHSARRTARTAPHRGGSRIDPRARAARRCSAASARPRSRRRRRTAPSWSRRTIGHVISRSLRAENDAREARGEHERRHRAVPGVDPREALDRARVDLAGGQRELERQDRGQRENGEMMQAGERPIEKHRPNSPRQHSHSAGEGNAERDAVRPGAARRRSSSLRRPAICGTTTRRSTGSRNSVRKVATERPPMIV